MIASPLITQPGPKSLRSCAAEWYEKVSPGSKLDGGKWIGTSMLSDPFESMVCLASRVPIILLLDMVHDIGTVLEGPCLLKYLPWSRIYAVFLSHSC